MPGLAPDRDRSCTKWVVVLGLLSLYIHTDAHLYTHTAVCAHIHIYMEFFLYMHATTAEFIISPEAEKERKKEKKKIKSFFPLSKDELSIT